MTIYIAPWLKLKDIQQRFREAFPYLKIEFFSGSIVETSGVMKNVSANKDLRILDFAAVNTRQIIITPRSTVQGVEQFFFTGFSLYVKIFRKSEHSWADISSDDKWILQKHNWIGREESGALFDFELL
jgi:hypothetical protein